VSNSERPSRGRRRRGYAESEGRILDGSTGILEHQAQTGTTRDVAAVETPVEVNERGYMIDLSRWSPGVALFLARRQGLAGWPRKLTADHWRVIEYTRTHYHRTGAAPSLRKTCAALGLTKRQFRDLFPGGLTTVRRVSGLPGPRRSARGPGLSKGQQLLASSWWERLTSSELQHDGKGAAGNLPSTSPAGRNAPRGMESKPPHVGMEFIWTLGQEGRSPRSD
jgi:TusE/DsrC/DsvC family sulfur relay protein